GVFIFGASDNDIGYITGLPGMAPGNVISANGTDGNFADGIHIESGKEDYLHSVDNRIQGNIIGLDTTGIGTLGLGGSPTVGNGIGISIISGYSTRIGGENLTLNGSTLFARNIISGNLLYGIYGVSASKTSILGNFIGTDITGTLSRRNS